MIYRYFFLISLALIVVVLPGCTNAPNTQSDTPAQETTALENITDDEENLDTSDTDAVINAAQASDIALGQFPNDAVIDTWLGTEDGRQVWYVDMRSGREIYVDAVTGTVLDIGDEQIADVTRLPPLLDEENIEVDEETRNQIQDLIEEAVANDGQLNTEPVPFRDEIIGLSFDYPNQFLGDLITVQRVIGDEVPDTVFDVRIAQHNDEYDYIASVLHAYDPATYQLPSVGGSPNTRDFRAAQIQSVEDLESICQSYKEDATRDGYTLVESCELITQGDLTYVRLIKDQGKTKALFEQAMNTLGENANASSNDIITNDALSDLHAFYYIYNPNSRYTGLAFSLERVASIEENALSTLTNQELIDISDEIMTTMASL